MSTVPFNVTAVLPAFVTRIAAYLSDDNLVSVMVSFVFVSVASSTYWSLEYEQMMMYRVQTPFIFGRFEPERSPTVGRYPNSPVRNEAVQRIAKSKKQGSENPETKRK